MNKATNKTYAIFDRRKFLTVAEGVALWKGIIPLDKYKLPDDLRDFKRLVQETLFLLGCRSKRHPQAAPLICDLVPRDIWPKVCIKLNDRPPAFFTEERHRRKRRGLDRDIQTYEAVHRIMKIRECPKERAYEILWRLGDDVSSIKARERTNQGAVKSAYRRGEKKSNVSKVSRDKTN